jgi:hypothetical protein
VIKIIQKDRKIPKKSHIQSERVDSEQVALGNLARVVGEIVRIGHSEQSRLHHLRRPNRLSEAE